MEINRVRQAEGQVNISQTLKLDNIGYCAGTAHPAKTSLGGAMSRHNHHLYRLNVSKLPEGIRQSIEANPLLQCQTHVELVVPRGTTHVNTLGLLGKIKGGIVPEGLRPFFKQGREILDSERYHVIRHLKEAGKTEMIQHVLDGGNLYDYAPKACHAQKDCEKLLGNNTQLQETADTGQSVSTIGIRNWNGK